MHELLTPGEMARVDAMAPDISALIDAAGRAVARAIMTKFSSRRTLVLMGPGHNGTDGRVAADYLRRAGWPVTVKPFLAALPAEVERAELVIDAIFGAGLSRDVDSHVENLLRTARCIAAIDTPSGVDGATGQVRGYAPQAALTVTFFRAKPGHYLYPGRALCGELVIADIGLPASALQPINPQTWLNTPALWTLPERAATGHKYTSGDVTVLCGSMPGAARLACAAARRAGAGMVTLAARVPMILPEAGLIVRHDDLATLLEDTRRQVWVCGPGLGPDAAAKLAQLIAAGRTIVADADALSACAGAPDKLRGATVITPHEGELTRVFGSVGPDKLAAARAAAARIGAVTILKGGDTVIASPDGRAAINNNAPPTLATGGTGDVLAGLVASLLAQKMPPFEAACAAVWLHGKAAEVVGPGLIAEDLPDAIVRAKEALLF